MAAELLVGTYDKGGGGGLTPLRQKDGRWVVGEPVPAIRNASWAVRSRRNGLWYFVDEQGERINVHAGDDFRQLASVVSGGEAPCHLALDAAERHLAVANYGSGSVALIRLDDQGLPIEPAAVHQNDGSGPNPERQEGPHAHWVGFPDQGGPLYCVDLGADRILAFETRTSGDIGSPRVAYAAPPGSGPRHLAFHPSAPIAWLVSELASTLTVLRREEDGSLSALRIISTLPPGGSGESLGGAIALNHSATRLYVSNRGHDSIAVFALDPSGMPNLLQHMPSSGASPRFILLLKDERQMAVAHEEDGTVSVFNLLSDGRLSPDPQTLTVPGAAFLARRNGAS
jgi:6-phosphogluconolactonase